MSKTASVGTLKINGIVNTTGITKGLATMRGQINTFATGTTKMMGSVVGAIGGVGAALGVALGGMASVKTAIGVEDQMIQVAKAANLSGDAIKSTRDEIVDLGDSLKGVSTSALFDAALGGAKSNVPAEQLRDYAEAIGKLSISMEDVEPAEIARSLGILSGIFKMDAIEGAKSFGSAIDKLAESAITSNSNIMDITKRFAQVGNVAGLAASDIIAMSTVLSATGVRDQKAGSSLSRAFDKILDTSKHAAFADAMGISVEEFAQMVEDKPMDAMKGFLKAISEIEDKTKKLSTVKSVGIAGEATSHIVALANEYDNLVRLQGISAEQFESQEQIERNYGLVSETTSANIQQLKNNLLSLSVAIGDRVLPPLNSLFESLKPVIMGIKSLFEDANVGITESLRRTGDWVSSWGLGLGKVWEYVGQGFSWLYDTVGYILRNLPDLFELTGVMISEAVMNWVATSMSYQVYMGDLLGWLQSNWFNAITDIFQGLVTLGENTWKNMTAIFDAGWKYITSGGTSKFEFEMTPLFDGFESALDELPERVKPAIISLADQMEAITDRISAREMSREMEKVIEAAEKQVLDIAEHIDDDDELEDLAPEPSPSRLASNLELGSAAAFKTIADFRSGFKNDDSAQKTAENTAQMNQQLERLIDAVNTNNEQLLEFVF